MLQPMMETRVQFLYRFRFFKEFQMATSIVSLIYDAQLTASLRQWVGGFFSSLNATTGWLQTNDTGQADITAIVGIGVTGDTPIGYRVYTFSDALSATNPVYVKIEYGTGTAPGYAFPGMWITVGTGTNGAGTLTGQVSQRLALSDPAATIASYLSYFSGGPSRFICGLFDSLNINWIISIERSKNSAGADNGDGIILHVASRRGGTYQQFIPYTGTVVAAMPFWMGAFSPYTTMAVNNLVGITFPTPFNAVPYNSGYNLAISNGSDIPMYNQVIGTIYGQSHNYLQLQYNNTIQIAFPLNPNNATGGGQPPFNSTQIYPMPLRPLIRYD